MRRVNNSIFQGDPPKLDMSQFWNKPVDYPFQEEEQPSPPANRTQLAIDRGYLPEREEGLSNQEYMDALAENPKEKKPFDFFNFGLGMRRASAGLSWLSGIKERNRQNQYLQNQLSTLGQLDALPAEQPNPYNLYAKYGGKLSKFANGGQEDPKKKQQDPKKKQQDPPKREPIIVNDKNDPRLRAYNDSLEAYNSTTLFDKKIMKYAEARGTSKDILTNSEYIKASGNKKATDFLLNQSNKPLSINKYTKQEPYEIEYTGNYKKPVQPVIYKSHVPDGWLPLTKEIAKGNTPDNFDLKDAYYKMENGKPVITYFVKPELPKPLEEKKLQKPIPIYNRKSLVNFSTDSRPTPDAPPEFQVAQFDNTKPTKYSFSYPTGKYNEQKTVYFPDAGTWKQFIGSQRLINSDEGKDYGTATGYMKKGGLTPNKAREILHDGTAQGHPYAKYGGKLSKFAGGGEKEDPKKKDIDPKVLARMQNPQQGDLSSQMGIINQNNQIKIQQNAPAIKKYMEDKDFNRRMNNQPTLSARKKLTPYEQEQADKYRRKRNEQYVALHPERTLNEQGDIVKSGFGEFVDKYGDNLDKFANSLETPMAIQGAGELLYAGTKYALPKVGEYLMTQTPLKNAYKLNPWAFKPNSEAYYRGIGKEGMDDILNSGIIRSKKQNAYPEPYFSKGKIGDAYAKGYFAELTNEPMKGVGNFSTGDLIQTPVSKVSINNPNLKLYQKDWLRGYKEVPKPTGMEALPYGLGKLRKLAKPGLVKAGKQLTENTPLKNAYKLNPFALNLQSQAKENIGRIISNDSIKNLEDLKYAANWAKEYGYKLPENLERISQSKELTDRTIRGLMDRHNTFTRGVSTNWKFLEEKNPEILRHLEGKGFDLTSEEGTKKAAEYMATHIPIETGYGRASLNKSIFDKGMDGLYTSNSIPTAEGYTYGDGFIVKAKKPTNFTSVNRRDWVDNNQLDYMTSLKKDKQELQQSFMFTNSSSEDISNLEMHYGKENANIIKNWYDDIHKKEIELRKKYNINNKGKGNYSIDHIVGKKLDDSDYASGKFDEIIKNHKENVSKFNNELIEYKSKTQEEIVKNFVSNDSHVLKSILKTEHYPGKPEQFFQVGNKDIGLGKIHSDIIPNLGLSSRETDRLKNDIIKLTEGFRKKGWDTKKISENLKQYLKDQYQNDPYAHYIHLGTPGEKVLEPVWSKRITPEIWKNKSRAHTNIYSKGLTAASVIPAIMATSSLNKKEFKKGGLTPNKAREILHDGTAQGHPLTDKQRRFFGAKSKGHTNFRGRK